MAYAMDLRRKVLEACDREMGTKAVARRCSGWRRPGGAAVEAASARIGGDRASSAVDGA